MSPTFIIDEASLALWTSDWYSLHYSNLPNFTEHVYTPHPYHSHTLLFYLFSVLSESLSPSLTLSLLTVPLR